MKAALLAAAVLHALAVSAGVSAPDPGIVAIANDAVADSAAVLHAPAATSEEGGYEMQFLPQVIPPTPQAAALARYGEYPVSHSTGIPDITIPLYEITEGNYSLPISISYHASGIKFDDVATPVGLGWTLNAGGVISRNIYGAPDFEYSEKNDTTYRNINNVINLITKNSNIELLKRILCDYEYAEWDTESDRYAYNYPSGAGLFRYSHSDKKFIPLNYTLEKINKSGTKTSSYFHITNSDGIGYYFKWHECTGIANDERYVYTTAWYLTEIHTPHGIIEFSYTGGENGDIYHSFGMMKYVDVTYSGKKPDGTPHTSTLTQGIPITFKPALLEKITWSGGTVEFNYTADRKDICPDRLSSIVVLDPKKNVRKEIMFSNEKYWGDTGKRANCRMLLDGIHDTENGKYSFTYDTTFYSPIPYGSKKCKWDYWGYPNGNVSTHATSKEVVKEIMKPVENFTAITKYTAQCANRLSNLRNMRAGSLLSITHPTGGTTKFQYETNQWYRKGNLENIGGLRILSITNDSITKSYEYIAPQALYDPVRFSIYKGTRMYTKPYSTTFNDVYVGISSPMLPGFIGSTLAAHYMTVKERLSDGSYTEYNYTDEVLTKSPDIFDEWDHPLILDTSCLDHLDVSPLLESKKIYSADNKLSYSEEYSYDNIETKRFSTGVKIVNKLIEWPLGEDAESPDATVVSGHTGSDCIGYAVTSAVSTFKRLKQIIYSDLIAGTSVTSDFSYDTQLRTVSPRSVSFTNSDGKRDSTLFEFPFDRNGDIYSDMAIYMPDVVVGKRTYRNGVQATRISAEHDNSLWHMPEAVFGSIGDGPLYETYRIINADSIGNPLVAVRNQSDTTRYEWDQSGRYLLKLIQPGGFTTRYSHKPLFGVDTLTDARGYQTQYSYRTSDLSYGNRINEGKLTMIKDHRGLLSTFSYNVVNGGDSLGGNFIRESVRLNQIGAGVKSKTRFFDGFGRPTITALSGVSPTKKYIHTLTTYDSAGRIKDKWLPVAISEISGDLTPAELSSLSFNTYFDALAYSTIQHDPVGRESAISTPGELWRGYGKGKTISHSTNTGFPKVKRYYAPTENTSLIQDGYYSEGSLLCETMTDEDGKTMSVFSDLSGKKILERRGNANDTYFVYNDYGQLRYVLSPEYQSAGYKAKYAYEYRYDSRGNVVKKFLPGCGYEQYWYDRANRLTFMQDATLRENGLYRFFLYDAAGRLAIKGTCKSCSRGEQVNCASYIGNNTGFMSTGYAISDESRISSPTLEIVNFYDVYPNSKTASTIMAADPNGLLTMTLNHLTQGETLATRYYYDLLGNVIYKTDEEIDGSVSSIKTEYSISGKPVKSTFSHKGIKLITENTYDRNSELIVESKISIVKGGITYSNPAIKYEYDDFGRLVKTIRPSSVGDITMSYNLHGKLSTISSRAFSQKLFYADGPGTRLYNGSVSAMMWLTPDLYRWRGYKYTYNNLGWLTKAEYGENESITTDKNHYTVSILDFSENGSIRRLQRHGRKDDGIYGKIDNLHLNYDGNRLVSIEEDADPVTREGANDFNLIDGNSHAYTYNSVGALTSDLNRGISHIGYDNLNHPTEILFNRMYRSIKHEYTPDNRKLSTIYTSSRYFPGNVNGTLPTGDYPTLPWNFFIRDTIQYCGPVIYENREIRQIMFNGGYATLDSDGKPVWHYFDNDYLGNVRSVTKSDGTVEQINHYYPFGLTFADAGRGADVQQYRHGGKELYPVSDLHWSDFGTRFYSPQLCSWTSMDPFCEKYYHLSPYSFCANAPTQIIDPTGEKLVVVIDGKNHALTYANGKIAIDGAEPGTSFFGDMVDEAISYLLEGFYGSMLLYDLINHPTPIYIEYMQNTNQFIDETNTIYWDYQKKECGISPLGPGGYYRPIIPSFIILAHEMFHAYDFRNGTLLYFDFPGNTIKYSEVMACNYENLIRNEHGVPLRSHYKSIINGLGIFPKDGGIPKLF